MIQQVKIKAVLRLLESGFFWFHKLLKGGEVYDGASFGKNTP